MLHDNARTITSVQGYQIAGNVPKTVTIVSPAKRTRSESQQHSDADAEPLPGCSSSTTTDTIFMGRSLRRFNSDIESVSSKSSSHSLRSLDREPASKSDSGSNSRKSSGGSDAKPKALPTWNLEDYSWDFPNDSDNPEGASSSAIPSKANDEILSALARESEAATQRPMAGSSSQPSASKRPSIATIDSWEEAQRKRALKSKSRAEESSAPSEQSKIAGPSEVKIDIPEHRD